MRKHEVTFNSAEDIKKFEQYRMLEEMAKNEGVYLTVMEYHYDHPIPKDAGTYIVLTPNDKYAYDIKCKPEELPRLLEKQKNMGYDRINPCYMLFDVTNLTKENAFDKFMDITRAIQLEAIIINACREIGYDVYPRCIDRYAVAEIEKLNEKRLDPATDMELRIKMQKTYLEFVSHVYHKYVDREEDLYLRPNTQQVERDFFVKHKIPVCYDRVNEHFYPYLMKQLEKYPEFYFYLDKEPSVHHKSVAKLWKGNPLANPYKQDVEVKKWDIAFPVDKQQIFYRILMDYNTRDCHPESALVYVGANSDLVKLTIDLNDIWNWDSLATANKVRYYINKGDITPLSADTARNITVVVNKEDMPMVNSIMRRLFNEQTTALPIDRDKVAANKEVVGEDHESLQANREFVEENVEQLKYQSQKAGFIDINYDPDRR